MSGPTTPHMPKHTRFGLFPFRSPLLRESIFLSLSAGNKMFQFPAYAHDLSHVPCLQHGGFPHSDTCGSNLVCRSPHFFAACRVLHRSWKPRHPPYALFSLFSRIFALVEIVVRITLFSNTDCSFFLPLYLFPNSFNERKTGGITPYMSTIPDKTQS